MNKYIRKSIIFLGVILCCCIAIDLAAQCPMCRMAAESNLKNGGTEAIGLNNGILYMLAMPYLIIATIAYLWWRNRKKEKEENVITP